MAATIGFEPTIFSLTRSCITILLHGINWYYKYSQTTGRTWSLQCQKLTICQLIYLGLWYSLKDLNLRPVPCKGTTLPTELSELGGSNKTSNLYLSQNKGVMLLIFTRTFNPLLINCTSVNAISISFS